MIRVVKLGLKVIGVNNCNLESFEVDFGIIGWLWSMVFEGIIICVLSGINFYDDVLSLKKDGVNVVLVGEFIMCVLDVIKFIS